MDCAAYEEMLVEAFEELTAAEKAKFEADEELRNSLVQFDDELRALAQLRKDHDVDAVQAAKDAVGPRVGGKKTV
jgi:hypothetical protein